MEKVNIMYVEYNQYIQQDKYNLNKKYFHLTLDNIIIFIVHYKNII